MTARALTAALLLLPPLLVWADEDGSATPGLHGSFKLSADGQVAGAAPQFQVTSVQEFTPAQDAEIARRIQGTFEVPCYLSPNCEPGGSFDLGPDGLTISDSVWRPKFSRRLE